MRSRGGSEVIFYQMALTNSHFIYIMFDKIFPIHFVEKNAFF